MAISREQIYAAIEAITATGQKPTTISIRQHLGTGSLGTINPVLKEWRETQAPPTLPPASPSIPVPQPFIDGVEAVIPQLWAVAAETANTMLATERTAWIAERDELKASLEETIALEAASAADLETALAQNIELAAQIEDIKTEHAAALEEQTTARITAEQQTAVLLATNNQMQTRIDDFQNANAELKNNIAALKAQIAASDNHVSKLNVSIEHLKTTHSAALEEQAAARVSAEQEAAVLKATNNQMQTRIDDLLNIRDEKNIKLADIKAELAEQIKATHAAEKRAVTAEATLAALRDKTKKTPPLPL